MSENLKISSNKSFGIVFFIVFLIIGVYPILSNEEIRVWSLVISIIFLYLGLIIWYFFRKNNISNNNGNYIFFSCNTNWIIYETN